MEYQQSFFGGQPDDEAIKMIKYFEGLALEHDPRGYCVCTSEGKDSRVLGHLMRRTKVKHFYLHSITGIDPPELIYFQRKNFQDYKDMGYLTYDVMYEKSMWQMIVENTILPMRSVRYCCSELKEKRSLEQGKSIVCLGVRKNESIRRALNREALETGNYKNKIIMSFDNEENRRTFETCYKDNEKRVNPIIEWTGADIWNYSNDVKLEQCCLYQCGFERLGCIGCPLAREKSRRFEFERYPKFKRLYLIFIQKALDKRKAQGKKVTFDNANDYFEWWLSDKAQEKVDENQMEFEL